MRVLIVRTACRGVASMAGFYNSQELGLACALSRLGHTCDIVLFGGKEEHVEEVRHDMGDGRTVLTKVYYLKGLALYDTGLFFGLNALAKGYDILQVAEYDQMQSWLLARRFKEKVVVYHGPYFSAFNKRYNLKCAVADKIFIPGYKRWETPFIAKSGLAADFLMSKGLSDVIEIGVGLDTTQLTSGAQLSEDGAKLVAALEEEKSNGVRRLLYIGRIEPRRNPDILVNLVHLLLAEGVNVSLTVIGRGDEAYVSEWRSGIENLGISSRIHYVPGLPNACLRDIYALCEVFLLPTSFEIFGMVLLEAMYYGLVPVTTVNGGSSTLIEQGVTGIVVESLCVDDWSSAISGLLANNSALVSMGEAATRRIREGFTWDSLAPKFVSEYERLCARNNH